jgi:hypothetical protein
VKRRLFRVAAPVAACLLLFAGAPSAFAESPLGDGLPGSHTHHVHTGNGGCVDIDAVSFLPLDRGLHRGANESGFETGPWHGPCH